MKELSNYYRIKCTQEENYASVINPYEIALSTGCAAEIKY